MINLKMTKMILSPLGYDVQTASSGLEGIVYLRKNSVDLILLDVEMPDMNGIETLIKIRELPGCAELPVMFLTADGQTDTVKDAFKLQACDYLKKPYLPEELRARVENIFAQTDRL